MKFIATIAMALLMSSGLSGNVSADNWTQSKWGPEDEIGALNLITPQSVLAASKLIKTGKTYNLGMIIDAKTPAYPPRTLSLTILQPGQTTRHGLGPTKTTCSCGFRCRPIDMGPRCRSHDPRG
jgi:hypothetical protein